MEESDDRLRPGISASLGLSSVEASLYHYSRKFGPVDESTFLLALAHRFPLPVSANLTAAVGVAGLRESTTIEFSAKDADHNVDEDRDNLGGFLSLKYARQIYESWYWQFAWEAALFPAGVSGGILLATGRKQLMTLSAGYQW